MNEMRIASMVFATYFVSSALDGSMKMNLSDESVTGW